jgi:ribonuclease BN (tRNA processing enzyme)
MRAGVVALARDADLLIYDTQFTKDEYKLRPHWGHSHPDDAIAIAHDAGQAPLLLPPRAAAHPTTTTTRSSMAARWSAKSHGDGFNVIAAHEGLELTLGDDDPAAVVTP